MAALVDLAPRPPRRVGSNKDNALPGMLTPTSHSRMSRPTCRLVHVQAGFECC